MCSCSGKDSASYVGVGFDLHQHARVDQCADLEHGGDGTDVAEDLAVGAADRLPLRDVGDVHARTDHVVHARTGHGERRLDVGQGLLGLHVGVAGARDDAILHDRRAAGDPHVRARAHDAAVTHDRLVLDAGPVALDGQWRKWPSPVKTIAPPASSAAATTSSSRTEPPGCTIALMPAAIATDGPSAKGKKASDAMTVRLMSSSRHFSTAS